MSSARIVMRSCTTTNATRDSPSLVWHLLWEQEQRRFKSVIPDHFAVTGNRLMERQILADAWHAWLRL